MGGGGKSSGAPTIAATPPPVVSAPAAPQVDTSAIKAEEDKKVQKMKQLDRMKRGRSATILTDGEGIIGDSNTKQSTLLGQKQKLGD